MSNFLSQSISHAKELGAHLSNVAHNVQTGIQNGNLPIPTSAMAPTIEHIGKYTVIVKHRLAEGIILYLFFIYFFVINIYVNIHYCIIIGAYGLVDLVVDQQTQKEYVLKRCSIARPEIFELVNKEIKFLKLFAGPYTVEFLGSEIVNQARGREALILLGFCPGGNLFEKLSTRNGAFVPFQNCLKIFQQILLSVKPFHDHTPPVTHRDLKLENILFAVDGTIRLCDFGSCSVGHTYLRNQTERSQAEEIIAKETTPMYRAPEMVDLYHRDILTEKTDIWALGCIFFTICYLKNPFQDVGSLGILNGKIPFPADAPFPNEAKELVIRMLDPDPEVRPTLDQLLYWISQLIQGQPLPEYILTAEAQQKRVDRIAANNVRAQKKSTKKPQPVAAPKATQAGVASDSVAAKRLAAKRGGLQSVSTYEPSMAPVVPQQNYSGFSSDTDGFAADFGSFGSSTTKPATNTSNANASSFPSTSSNAPVFDAFGDNDNLFQPSSASNNGFQPTVASAAVGKHDTADFLFDTEVVNVGDDDEFGNDGFSLPSAPSPMKPSSMASSPAHMARKQSHQSMTPSLSSSFGDLPKPSPGNQLGFDAFGDNFSDPFGKMSVGKGVFTPPVSSRVNTNQNSRQNSNDYNAFEPSVPSVTTYTNTSSSSSFGFDESFLDGFAPSVSTGVAAKPNPTIITTPARSAIARGGTANSSSSNLKSMVPSNLTKSRECNVDDFGMPVTASFAPPPSPSRIAQVTSTAKPLKPIKPAKPTKAVDLLSDPVEYSTNTSSSGSGSIDVFSDEYLLSRPATASTDLFNTTSNPLQPTTLQNQSVLRLFDNPPHQGSGSPISSARSIPGRANLQSSSSTKDAFDLLG